ncbi:MAG TPA: hypothetical protein VGG37_02395 [Opitutaceae bacterium]
MSGVLMTPGRTALSDRLVALGVSAAATLVERPLPPRGRSTKSAGLGLSLVRGFMASRGCGASFKPSPPHRGHERAPT